jgi:hypothetical protein
MKLLKQSVAILGAASLLALSGATSSDAQRQTRGVTPANGPLINAPAANAYGSSAPRYMRPGGYSAYSADYGLEPLNSTRERMLTGRDW